MTPGRQQNVRIALAAIDARRNSLRALEVPVSSGLKREEVMAGSNASLAMPPVTCESTPRPRAQRATNLLGQ